jgi:hypothetical protein
MTINIVIAIIVIAAATAAVLELVCVGGHLEMYGGMEYCNAGHFECPSSEEIVVVEATLEDHE